ncbi:uncharacterized protein LY89DRAFT_676737 [Mollisia scopiformis]|uniref:Uncharacterized protein n=1 Tax=Mollisia scopiformis TaxID=149040 RepID=A0A132BAG0_MOLSC|nr:uncharacterized protein LY89DRAFT_676737 [Mollisia scopiformis]KUJ08844.1 hypothetical protein LY89DRAFT_676737 [Mollisia scopiformis]
MPPQYRSKKRRTNRTSKTERGLSLQSVLAKPSAQPLDKAASHISPPPHLRAYSESQDIAPYQSLPRGAAETLLARDQRNGMIGDPPLMSTDPPDVPPTRRHSRRQGLKVTFAEDVILGDPPLVNDTPITPARKVLPTRSVLESPTWEVNTPEEIESFRSTRKRQFGQYMENSETGTALEDDSWSRGTSPSRESHGNLGQQHHTAPGSAQPTSTPANVDRQQQSRTNINSITDYFSCSLSFLFREALRRSLNTKPSAEFVDRLVFKDELAASTYVATETRRGWLVHSLYDQDIQEQITAWNTLVDSGGLNGLDKNVLVKLQSDIGDAIKIMVTQKRVAELALMRLREAALNRKVGLDSPDRLTGLAALRGSFWWKKLGLDNGDGIDQWVW